MHCARSATAYRAHVEMGVAGRRVGWGSRRAALWCRQVDWTQSCSARGRAADTEVSRRWASNGPIFTCRVYAFRASRGRDFAWR